MIAHHIKYVTGIYTGGASSHDRSKLWDSKNSKYVEKYTETTDSKGNYYGNTTKYGDAIYETSNSGCSLTGGWDSSFSYFPESDFPVFCRGGRAADGGPGSVFAFGYGAGEPNAFRGFRPVVISSKP